MEGPDVKAFQLAIKHRLKSTGLADEVPVAKHGKFTQATWDAFCEAAYTLGLRESSYRTLQGGHGVASKGAQKFVRNPIARTDAQKLRAKDRKKHVGPKYLGSSGVASPLAKLGVHSNGWNPKVPHDGVDLICDEGTVLFAICDAEVVDVRADGWWGLGAQATAPHKITDGDGIIQLECLVAGPSRRACTSAMATLSTLW